MPCRGRGNFYQQVILLPLFWIRMTEVGLADRTEISQTFADSDRGRWFPRDAGRNRTAAERRPCMFMGSR